MNKFIYLNPHSIPKELCSDIIQYFEEEKDNWYKGVTASGVNNDIKDTFDFQIRTNDPKSKWFKVQNFLSQELNRNVNKYMKSLNDNPKYNENRKDNQKFKLIGAKYLTEATFQMQKYLKNQGKYIYHNDFSVDFPEKKYRVITYLWYINTVEEGGETEVLGETSVKPEAGKLLLFPACWTFPHTGKIPISDDKYIITGWFYMHQ
jgi:hypothetical protein